MITARDIREVRAALDRLPRPLGLVPTMGALHEGHLSLVRGARDVCAAVAASVFVNPTQFAAGEDLERYPRDEQRDLELLAAAGADVVFVPAAAEMYPPGFATVVRVDGPLTSSFEAATRPGHFEGVTTVVLKLIHIVLPDRLYLGEKDAQQLAVVKRMLRDLDVALHVIGVPTVREPDGLAMSSRNAYLSPAERSVAPRLYQALRAGADAAGGGASAAAVRERVAAALRVPATDARNAQPAQLELEYAAVVDAATFTPAAMPRPGDLLVAAARLGGVRLIDNIRL